MFLDLDRFKGVNDTLGHNAGDRLLVALAERLRRALRPSDTVARLAGDEFVVVCEDVEDGGVVAEIGERLLAAVERPFRIDGVDASVSVSIGVAIANRADLDAESLLRKADAAMYEVKDRSRARSRASTQPFAAIELRADDLRRALDDGELRVAYLPQVALREGRMVAVEALARWRHPDLGPISPETFLEVAQAEGLVVELGRQVLRSACAAASSWAAVAEGADGLAAAAGCRSTCRYPSWPSPDLVESIGEAAARGRPGAGPVPGGGVGAGAGRQPRHRPARPAGLAGARASPRASTTSGGPSPPSRRWATSPSTR